MDRLKMRSPKLVQENMARLQALFPGCVTESYDSAGQLRLAVDFDLLRQELTDALVEGPQERYHLNWPGKREALLTAHAPTAMTLRPCLAESVNFASTRHLFIEGDNLEVLKLLQETYLGQIKMIYIDPPYNTGHDFIYADDFAEDAESFLLRSQQRDAAGNRLVANTEANGRFHSDWLSMMYPRLKLARHLLRDDGVIFISIDDKEQANLRKICDEIYGAENHRGTLIWQHSVQPKGYAGTFSVHHNFIFCYARSAAFALANLPRTDAHNRNYSNPDQDPRGPWRPGDVRNALYRANLMYDIPTPSGKVIRHPEKGWRWSRETLEKRIATGEIIFSADETRIIRKIYLQSQAGRTPETLLLAQDVGSTRDAAQEIKDLFGEAQPFDTPKPLRLLEHLLRLSGATADDRILDFFAGSSTTAHAVLRLNADDGGQRRFIMVQMPEPCAETSVGFKKGFRHIAEISKERLRRAGRAIAAGDVGFRVLKLDSSNMVVVHERPDDCQQERLLELADAIKPDRDADDLLFQVLLDAGVDLSSPLERLDIQGKKVFRVGDLLAFFEAVEGALAKALAELKPARMVFRESGFASDALKINVIQLFAQLSPGTLVKSI